MSMMHRRRMVIERAKKMKLEKEGETDGNQGQNSERPIPEGKQSGKGGGSKGRKKGGA